MVKKNKKILYLLAFTSLFISAIFVSPALASSTDGTIVSSNKYAWTENAGWVDFGSTQGNVHVTDSVLSGYAWSETLGWISLNCSNTDSCDIVDYKIANDGQGNLSGHAWTENSGWIDFDPTGGGVTINSSGEFIGHAWGENIGWIVFNCATTDSCATVDYKVSTDWRPRSARPACNNATDDDGDGKIDYPADPGCSSLTDTDEADPVAQSGGGGLPSGAVNSPSAPVGGFSVVINSGASAVNTRNVVLQLKAGADTTKMAVSNFQDFHSSSQEVYQSSKAWMLEEGDGPKSVYVKFFTQYGQPSSVVSANIILDTTAPSIILDAPKEYYYSNQDIILSGKTEANARVTLHWDDKYGLVYSDPSGLLAVNLGRMAVGDHVLDLTPTDLAGNKGFSSSANLKIIQNTVQESTSAPVSPLTSVKNIIEQVPQAIKNITDKILGTEKPIKPPELIIIPRQTPIAFLEPQNLLPKDPIDQIALAPLPKEITDLAGKFSQLANTLKEVGVTKLSDIDKLKSVEFSLPGLTEEVGLAHPSFETGYFALAKGIPLSDLSVNVKEKMPTDIVFAKTAGELVDFNIALTVNDKNLPEQRISTIAGKPLQLSVKPENPVKSVKGYIVFKSRNKSQELGFDDNKGPVSSIISDTQVKIEDLVSSVIFGSPVFARPSDGEIKVEEKLVLAEFEYTDPDGDGIYTAEVQAPVTEGEYEVITVMDFIDPQLGMKEIRLITVVDPEGFVYVQLPDGKLRVTGAVVSLYWMNPTSKQYEIWSAKEYQQENPQITDDTGKYSFLVPPGLYYLKVESPKYPSYQSDVFTVKEGSGIHMDIELKSKNWWIRYVDWKMIVMFIFGALLFYNFYRDRRSDKRK